MPRFLVTGGLGFLGMNFLRTIPALEEYKDSLFVCLDKNTYAVNTEVWQTFMPKNVELEIEDITNIEGVLQILQRHEIDFVVHFAAETHVDKSFADSLHFTHNNVLGTHTLLEACKYHGKLTRFVHMSTDEVFGDTPVGTKPCAHATILDPTNPYAATKAGAENLVRSFWYSFKLPTVIVRCTNLYGPGQYPDKIVPKFYKLLKEGKKLPIHGTGDVTRRYIRVEDVCDALLLTLQRAEPGNIVHIASHDEWSVSQVAEKLVQICLKDTDVDKHIEYVADRNYNDTRYDLDTALLTSWGWKQRHPDFDAGLKDTVDWYEKHGFALWSDENKDIIC